MFLWFAKPFSTLLAFPPLDIVPSASRFYCLDFARMARHFGLAFFGRKRQNDSG